MSLTTKSSGEADFVAGASFATEKRERLKLTRARTAAAARGVFMAGYYARARSLFSSDLRRRQQGGESDDESADEEGGDDGAGGVFVGLCGGGAHLPDVVLRGQRDRLLA